MEGCEVGFKGPSRQVRFEIANAQMFGHNGLENLNILDTDKISSEKLTVAKLSCKTNKMHE